MSSTTGYWIEVTKFDPAQIADALEAGIRSFQEQYGQLPTHVKVHPSLHTNGVFSTLLGEKGMTIDGEVPYKSWLAVGKASASQGDRTMPHKSTNVAQIDYDPSDDGYLTVQFHKHKCLPDCSGGGGCGSTYIYYGVEPEIYEMFLASESKGAFVNEQLRNEYTCEKVE